MSKRNNVLTALQTSAVAATLMLAACGGGGDGAAPSVTAVDVTAQVAPEAVAQPSAATAYVNALASTPASTGDQLEPVAVPASLATDDTAEPV